VLKFDACLLFWCSAGRSADLGAWPSVTLSGFAHDGERAPLAWALLSLADQSLLFGPIARVHVYRNKKGTPFARENGKNKCAIQKLHIDIGKSTLKELHLPGFRSAK
jgi:hypothetical protein